MTHPSPSEFEYRARNGPIEAELFSSSSDRSPLTGPLHPGQSIHFRIKWHGKKRWPRRVAIDVCQDFVGSVITEQLCEQRLARRKSSWTFQVRLPTWCLTSTSTSSRCRLRIILRNRHYVARQLELPCLPAAYAPRHQGVQLSTVTDVARLPAQLRAMWGENALTLLHGAVRALTGADEKTRLAALGEKLNISSPLHAPPAETPTGQLILERQFLALNSGPIDDSGFIRFTTQTSREVVHREPVITKMMEDDGGWCFLASPTIPVSGPHSMEHNGQATNWYFEVIARCGRQLYVEHIHVLPVLSCHPDKH